ncbi:Phytoene dehydrogenase-related protein [Rhodococcus maanshanensis]|uniref:Phytoene dehydrogenase-related protein n=1 Tax=Rhodococcus maanshanensis TaxID=183556 RepID=A0A1H7Y237_9NOCA|nr:Phytoene dehydrogenase-related protein [Rhodococcus maanshanensis]
MHWSNRRSLPNVAVVTDSVSVIGGGLAGLTAAIACAEAGARVTLHEAHATLGGRARATAGPYVAHEGAHVFYADGPHWQWLKRRGFVADLCLPPVRSLALLGFRSGGRFRRRPPMGMLRAQLTPWAAAPVDTDFLSWATQRFGHEAAKAMANSVGVATYEADTGKLSAAFVWNLFQRIYGPRLPGVRYVAGGWQAVTNRMAVRARDLGVRIELGSRVDAIPSTPTIVATELSSARSLLGDTSLDWQSGHCVMLDLAVREGRRDLFTAADLDEGGFHDCYSMQDRSVAPAGESLFQIDMPVRAGESVDQARTRLYRFTDLTVPDWRDRVTWQRTSTARGRTGAVDLPGQTWRDRPGIDRGSGVYLVGDMVAAPGMRGEIAINSAVRAATSVVAELKVSKGVRR